MKKLLVAGLALVAFGAQAVTLFNNGPVVNGSGLSVLTLPATTLGYGQQTAAGNSVAEDFTVGGAGWGVQSLSFYAYQTGSTAFTFTTATWSIVSGNVNSGTVVANGVTSVTSGGLMGFRVASTDLGGTTRGIYAVNVDVPDFNLAAGNYWLRWGLAGSLASGPWQPPTSDSVVGNGMQATTASGGVYAFVVDAGSLLQASLPFTISGTVTAVPEASTHAMLLLGALGVWGATRRRSQG